MGCGLPFTVNKYGYIEYRANTDAVSVYDYAVTSDQYARDQELSGERL